MPPKKRAATTTTTATNSSILNFNIINYTYQFNLYFKSNNKATAVSPKKSRKGASKEPEEEVEVKKDDEPITKDNIITKLKEVSTLYGAIRYSDYTLTYF